MGTHTLLYISNAFAHLSLTVLRFGERLSFGINVVNRHDRQGSSRSFQSMEEAPLHPMEG